jgi:hypothetical protein
MGLISTLSREEFMALFMKTVEEMAKESATDRLTEYHLRHFRQDTIIMTLECSGPYEFWFNCVQQFPSLCDYDQIALCAEDMDNMRWIANSVVIDMYKENDTLFYTRLGVDGSLLFYL